MENGDWQLQIIWSNNSAKTNMWLLNLFQPHKLLFNVKFNVSLVRWNIDKTQVHTSNSYFCWSFPTWTEMEFWIIFPPTGILWPMHINPYKAMHRERPVPINQRRVGNKGRCRRTCVQQDISIGEFHRSLLWLQPLQPPVALETASFFSETTAYWALCWLNKRVCLTAVD